jgi:hypothetical protein
VRVVDTSNWTSLEPYTEAITTLFRKLARRFPHDVTVRSLHDDCASGQKTLWLVLDGEELRGIAMTSVSTTKAGAKVGTVFDLAGHGMTDWIDAVFDELEAEAARQGCDFTAAEGRGGWRRHMKRRGYREHAVLWRRHNGRQQQNNQ